MSTDENLVARNQETAAANGLAAAHTRGRNLLLLFRSSSSSRSTSSCRSPAPPSPPLPLPLHPSVCPSRAREEHRSSLFRDRMPIETQLREKHSAIAISAARRHSRLVAYRNGNSHATLSVGFRQRSFFRRIDESRPSKIAAGPGTGTHTPIPNSIPSTIGEWSRARSRPTTRSSSRVRAILCSPLLPPAPASPRDSTIFETLRETAASAAAERGELPPRFRSYGPRRSASGNIGRTLNPSQPPSISFGNDYRCCPLVCLNWTYG